LISALILQLFAIANSLNNSLFIGVEKKLDVVSEMHQSHDFKNTFHERI